MTTILSQTIRDPATGESPEYSKQALLVISVEDVHFSGNWQTINGNTDWEYYRHGSFIQVRSAITSTFFMPQDLGELNTTRCFSEPLVEVTIKTPDDVMHCSFMELKRARRLVTKANELKPRVTLQEKVDHSSYHYELSLPSAIKGDIVFNLERADQCCLYCENLGTVRSSRQAREEINIEPVGDVTYPYWGRAVQVCPYHKLLSDRNMAVERKSS